MLKINSLKAGTAIGIAVSASLISTPVLAAGTTAGTDIVNTVSVNYQVGGVAQTQENASDTVEVDRKIDLTVAASDGTETSVGPGEVGAAVSFQVTNLSNDTLDFALTASQAAGDDFDVGGTFAYFLDDGDGVWEPGTDTSITHLNSLAPDTPVIVHVTTNLIPLSANTGDLGGLVLTALAKANDNGAAIGSDLVEALSNTAGVDNVFADGAGDTDGANDGDYSATDAYLVLAAALSATKTSTILSNGANFNTGTAIPGATIEYCITVSNAAGSATATNVAISDTLPATVTYVASSAKIGGADCNTPGGTNGSYAAGVVSGTIASLAAGDSQTLIFQATIN
jgi:uncharacterized repeat protein (TIGR01451 family)